MATEEPDRFSIVGFEVEPYSMTQDARRVGNI